MRAWVAQCTWWSRQTHTVRRWCSLLTLGHTLTCRPHHTPATPRDRWATSCTFYTAAPIHPHRLNSHTYTDITLPCHTFLKMLTNSLPPLHFYIYTHTHLLRQVNFLLAHSSLLHPQTCLVPYTTFTKKKITYSSLSKFHTYLSSNNHHTVFLFLPNYLHVHIHRQYMYKQ